MSTIDIPGNGIDDPPVRQHLRPWQVGVLIFIVIGSLYLVIINLPRSSDQQPAAATSPAAVSTVCGPTTGKTVELKNDGKPIKPNGKINGDMPLEISVTLNGLPPDDCHLRQLDLTRAFFMGTRGEPTFTGLTATFWDWPVGGAGDTTEVTLVVVSCPTAATRNLDEQTSDDGRATLPSGCVEVARTTVIATRT
jgi:hypothetical protein